MTKYVLGFVAGFLIVWFREGLGLSLPAAYGVCVLVGFVMGVVL